MTAQQMDEATMRLRELEREKLLSEETLRDLRKWWQSKLRDTRGQKVIPFDRRWRNCNG